MEWGFNMVKLRMNASLRLRWTKYKFREVNPGNRWKSSTMTERSLFCRLVRLSEVMGSIVITDSMPKRRNYHRKSRTKHFTK